MARKKADIHYIYKTTCNVTGRWYIGMHSTCNLDDGYMGSGKILRYSIRKYGKGNHTKEILEYLNSREELVLREIEIVNKELISDGKCMNLKEGGSGGFFSLEASKKGGINGIKKTHEIMFVENKEKYRLIFSKNSKKNWKDPNYRIKMLGRANWEGKSHSEETKQKMSESSKGIGIGETNSQYGTCWITKDGLNKKIKKEDIDTWVNEGWVKGRLK